MPATLVDDTDPAITYVGAWGAAGSAAEYNTTTHYTKSTGHAFTFTFNGTQISVFGTIPQNKGGGTATNIQYIVDNIPAQSQTLPPVLNNSYRTPFFSSPPLSQQQHTLVTVLTSVGPAYFLDYLTYDSSVEALPPSPTCPTVPPSPSCPTAPPPPAVSACAPHDTRITVLAAVVVPVCAVLIATVAVLGYCIRGRRMPPKTTRGGSVEPFVLSPAGEPRMRADLASDSRTGCVAWDPSGCTAETISPDERVESRGECEEGSTMLRFVGLHVLAGPTTAVEDAPPAYEGR
ncbi:hypothetical protein PHLGIDRAFT_275397 [Phlebiopsis gigantea 11061_1 CR5-6]|uniref:Uncharacterized protein n=1 Tax=Phlebiopsis gigantea (strain 11061_1 CR5-6) TaxID=745531 RepID=A0A0C3PCL8_PHLG1|nr:hypothetical protein PHLGIDRAFT_275397 [Phlebiopsis gigantea 11061_1 CR5-6]